MAEDNSKEFLLITNILHLANEKGKAFLQD